MKKSPLTVITYEKPKDCVSALCNRSDQFKSESFYEGYDEYGTKWSLTRNEISEIAVRMGCWGFVYGKQEIHCWYRKNCNFYKLVEFFSHELAHTIRPFCNHNNEEIKAGNYASVTRGAIVLANKVKTGNSTVFKIDRPEITPYIKKMKM